MNGKFPEATRSHDRLGFHPLVLWVVFIHLHNGRKVKIFLAFLIKSNIYFKGFRSQNFVEKLNPK